MLISVLIPLGQTKMRSFNITCECLRTLSYHKCSYFVRKHAIMRARVFFFCIIIKGTLASIKVWHDFVGVFFSLSFSL